MAEEFELSAKQRAELIELCGSEHEAARLIPFIADGYDSEQMLQWRHDYVEAPKVSHARAETMLKHLQAIDSLVDELGPIEMILDSHYELANRRYCKNPDELKIQVFNQNSWLRDGRSGFSILLERMIRAVESYRDELPEPKRGQNTNRNYTHTLLHLAIGFEEVFPGHKVSRSKNSKFFPICKWFLLNFTDWQGTFQEPQNADPSETIKKLIKYRKQNPNLRLGVSK